MADRKFVRFYPYALLCVVIGFGFFWWWWCGRASTTYLIVRHADRLGTADVLDPDLGEARRKELVHVFEKAGITGIYHSDTARARLTAEPTATALGITPVEIPANDVAALIDHIEANHRGRTVLVVGHSNTVPLIIQAAGGPTIPTIDEGEFDNLFVLKRCRCLWRRAKLLNLQYGAISPETP